MTSTPWFNKNNDLQTDFVIMGDFLGGKIITSLGIPIIVLDSTTLKSPKVSIGSGKNRVKRFSMIESIEPENMLLFFVELVSGSLCVIAITTTPVLEAFLCKPLYDDDFKFTEDNMEDLEGLLSDYNDKARQMLLHPKEEVLRIKPKTREEKAEFKKALISVLDPKENKTFSLEVAETFLSGSALDTLKKEMKWSKDQKQWRDRAEETKKKKGGILNVRLFEKKKT